MKKELEEKEQFLENIKDICGEENRVNGGRAVLIISENKKDVDDIIKALVIKHEYIYEYKGKIIWFKIKR